MRAMIYIVISMTNGENKRRIPFSSILKDIYYVRYFISSNIWRRLCKLIGRCN